MVTDSVSCRERPSSAWNFLRLKPHSCTPGRSSEPLPFASVRQRSLQEGKVSEEKKEERKRRRVIARDLCQESSDTQAPQSGMRAWHSQ